jgi:hypothetical protein
VRETLAEQPADFQSLETALLRAREIAEEFGEALVLYFIDMAIVEVRMKSPSTANDHKPHRRKQSTVSPRR